MVLPAGHVPGGVSQNPNRIGRKVHTPSGGRTLHCSTREKIARLVIGTVPAHEKPIAQTDRIKLDCCSQSDVSGHQAHGNPLLIGEEFDEFSRPGQYSGRINYDAFPETG